MRARSLITILVVVLAMASSALAQQLTDGGIYRWNNGNWMQMEGFGARISVGPDGAPWIVNAKNEVERRPIKIGSVDDNGVTIAEGLSGQESVVLSAGPFLNPGQKVAPKRQAAAR